MKKCYSYLVIGSLLFGSLLLTACSEKDTEVSGSYSAFLQGSDWGESISKVTLKLDKPVDSQTVSVDDFVLPKTK